MTLCYYTTCHLRVSYLRAAFAVAFFRHTPRSAHVLRFLHTTTTFTFAVSFYYLPTVAFAFCRSLLRYRSRLILRYLFLRLFTPLRYTCYVFVRIACCAHRAFPTHTTCFAARSFVLRSRCSFRVHALRFYHAFSAHFYHL